MVPAVIATGVVRVTSCQPEAVSAVKGAVASSTPVLLHTCATWEPLAEEVL